MVSGEGGSVSRPRGSLVSIVTAVLIPALAAACAGGETFQSQAGACSETASLNVPDSAVGGLAAGPHTVLWGGVRFWYCVSGAAESERSPVVFLHGGPGEGSQHFASLTGASLETDLRIVYFDQRGSGRSERPWRNDYDMERQVRDIEGLREALEVEQIILVGHSYGGLLGLEYASAYSERVSHLILVSGLSDVAATQRSVCERLETLDPSAYARAMEEPLPGGLCNSFSAYSGVERERFARESMYPDPTVGERVDSVDGVDGLRNTGQLSRALFAGPAVWSLRFSDHARLTMPVLVIAGRLDYQIGLAPQQALARELPNARLVVLDNAGHFAHVDDPVGFAEAVLSFLGSGS